MSLTRAKERATSACRCRCVSVSLQKYSVQYKGYNLIGVTTVEGGTARGTTTLVYLQLHISVETRSVSLRVYLRTRGTHVIPPIYTRM
jgi:hypothetical protein